MSGQETDLENQEVQEVQNEELQNQGNESQIDEQEIESASRFGWVPKEKYRGNPDDWVDAREFNEKFVPAIRANRQTHKELREELESVKRASQESMAILKKTQEEALARKDAELKEALSVLKSQHREAIRDGNDLAADEIESRIETLNTERGKLKEQPKAPEDTKKAPDPLFIEWVGENKWFESDPEMREYAMWLGEKWDREGFNPGGKALLEKMTETVRKTFPHKFENQNRNRPSPVEGGGKPSSTARGKTANDLPPEHRKIMREMVAEGMLTEADYIKNYFDR